MKKPTIYGLLLLASAALMSCYWISGSFVSDLSIDLSGLTAKGPGDRYVRVYLIANNKIYPLGEGTQYVEVPIPTPYPEIHLTLEDIPVGPTYRIWVSIGTEQSGGWFDTENWAESDTFGLSPGQERIVPFNEDDLYANVVFEPVSSMMGKSLRGVVVDSANVIITADERMMYYGYDLSTFTPKDLPDGYTVNTIDLGVDAESPSGIWVWFNTNRGILPNVDLVFDEDFSTKLGAVSVRGSAGRGTELGGPAVWFYRDGGLGGAYIDPDIAWNPASWSWVNLASDHVYDCLVAYPGDGYFATSGGLYHLPTAFLQDSTPDIEEYKKPLAAPGRVFSLGLIDQNGDGDTLFMGTDDGVWYQQIDMGEFTGSLQREPNTAGHSFQIIAISDFWPTFKAYLSDSYLFIYNGTSGSWSQFPLCAGLPGNIWGMTWVELGGTTVYKYLVVAGSEGMTYLLVQIG